MSRLLPYLSLSRLLLNPFYALCTIIYHSLFIGLVSSPVTRDAQFAKRFTQCFPFVFRLLSSRSSFAISHECYQLVVTIGL